MASLGTESATGTDTTTSVDTTSSPELCGNGELDDGEECDDGTNAGGYDGCEADCTFGPRCGDGDVHAREACDDGDEVQGNGCNIDCTASGLELWSHDAHVGSDDECVGIGTSDEGHLFLAGRVPNLDGADDAHVFWVQRVSMDGVDEWTREYAPFASATEHDYDPFAAVGTGDGVVLVGAHRQSVSLLSAYTDVPVVKFSAENGDVVWDRNDEFANFAYAVVEDPDGTIVVGAGDGFADLGGVYRVDSDGNLVGQVDFEPDEEVWALSRSDSGVLLAAGQGANAGFNTRTFVRARNAGFGTLWGLELDEGFNLGRSVAAFDDLVFVAGWDSSGWLVRLSGQGTLDWARDSDEVAALGFPNDVVATPEGDIIVAGARQGAPWIARMSAAGDLMWSRSPSESGNYSEVRISPATGHIVACGTVDAGGQGDNIYAVAYSP